MKAWVAGTCSAATTSPIHICGTVTCWASRMRLKGLRPAAGAGAPRGSSAWRRRRQGRPSQLPSDCAAALSLQRARLAHSRPAGPSWAPVLPMMLAPLQKTSCPSHLKTASIHTAGSRASRYGRRSAQTSGDWPRRRSRAGRLANTRAMGTVCSIRNSTACAHAQRGGKGVGRSAALVLPTVPLHPCHCHPPWVFLAPAHLLEHAAQCAVVAGAHRLAGIRVQSPQPAHQAAAACWVMSGRLEGAAGCTRRRRRRGGGASGTPGREHVHGARPLRLAPRHAAPCLPPPSQAG